MFANNHNEYSGKCVLIVGNKRDFLPANSEVIELQSCDQLWSYYEANKEKKADVIVVTDPNFDESMFQNCRLLAHENTILRMENRELLAKLCRQNDVIMDEREGVYKINICKFYIITLMRQDRAQYNTHNTTLFPFIELVKAVNGYDIPETMRELDEIGIRYVKLSFKTYGTLANWIAKYKMIKYQVDNKIPYICFLEDDLTLEPNFCDFIRTSLSHFRDTEDLNMLRLMKWGEGYVTSFEGSKRIMRHMFETGIIENIDNQLRCNCGKELYVEGAPMVLRVKGNTGDCLKTQKFSIKPTLRDAPNNNKQPQLLNIERERIRQTPLIIPPQPIIEEEPLSFVGKQLTTAEDRKKATEEFIKYRNRRLGINN